MCICITDSHNIVNHLHSNNFFFKEMNVIQLFPSRHHSLPWWLSGKESPAMQETCWRREFDPWVRKIHWGRK